MHPRPSLFLAIAALVLGCSRTAPSGPPDAASVPGSASATSSTSSPPTPRPPISLRGATLALTPDESTLIVADEDHEALFVVPAGLEGTSDARVVPLPGPPGQVVALDERVLVTIRTIPTTASRAARDKLRGPSPNVAGMRPAEEPWAAAVPSALAALDAAEPPAKASRDPVKAAGALSARRQRAERRANEAYARTRPRKTPPVIFDPSVVRQSLGGLLLVFRRDGSAGLVETGRVRLPPDAWGLAVTSDGRRALVTSPWSARVTLLELDGLRVLATASTRREPRGIALVPGDRLAYVSHLIGSTLSVLELGPASLEVRELPFPAAVARAPRGVTLEASLAYDLVLAPDAETLFVPRHALGAEGVGSWWGAATVDALDLTTQKPLAPAPGARLGARVTDESLRDSLPWEATAGQPPAPRLELVQPRGVAYRKTSNTLLVASEGDNVLTEVDALAPDPTMAIVKVYPLATSYDVYGGFPDRGGGPAGVALGRDERIAYVFCRTTFDVARIDLERGTTTFLHLADDGLPADAAYGRRLFADARNSALSGGIGCAACHPEGRDDGYVWREGELGFEGGEVHFIGRRENAKIGAPGAGRTRRPVLFPRQTPMLAGRVRPNGPFGWHAESPSLPERVTFGTVLHRGSWEGSPMAPPRGEQLSVLDYLVDYLRSGLLPPPTLVRELDATELRGKAIFESDEARCSRCHVPASEFTDRTALPLPALPVRPDFDPEPNPAFKTPSLWFIGGTAPYFHDGSQASLEDLVRTNRDRMGKTSHLAADEQAALIAYLRTL